MAGKNQFLKQVKNYAWELDNFSSGRNLGRVIDLLYSSKSGQQYNDTNGYLSYHA